MAGFIPSTVVLLFHYLYLEDHPSCLCFGFKLAFSLAAFWIYGTERWSNAGLGVDPLLGGSSQLVAVVRNNPICKPRMAGNGRGCSPILWGGRRSPWFLTTYKSWNDPPSRIHVTIFTYMNGWFKLEQCRQIYKSHASHGSGNYKQTYCWWFTNPGIITLHLYIYIHIQYLENSGTYMLNYQPKLISRNFRFQSTISMDQIHLSKKYPRIHWSACKHRTFLGNKNQPRAMGNVGAFIRQTTGKSGSSENV